ncbi:MAG: phospholipid carrier-dependent glycosyltransferase [Phycisphaerales bacterium]|nr:MAG: phospholipid carrier-dependent glycosyltransferase [Phycisphaerales bacterium]
MIFLRVEGEEMPLFYLLQYGLSFCLLGLALWLPGFVIERIALRGSDLKGLRTLVRVCLGLGFWMALLLLLASFQQLRPAVVWSAIGLLALLGLWVGFRFGIRHSNSEARFVYGPSEVLLVAVLCIMLAPFFLLAISPHIYWDSSAYHLTLPKLFMANEGFRYVPMNVYSNWPLNIELLFAMAMLVHDYILAKLIHFGFGLLTLYAIYAGCRMLHRNTSGWLAMFLFLANSIVAFELTFALVELAYAFFFLTGFLLMLWALDDSADRKTALLLSGVCCGILAGIKATGFVGAAVIATLYFVNIAIQRRGALWAELRLLLFRFALPVVVLWCPWLIKAAWYTGNPVYPFFYEWWGGPDWSSNLADQFSTWQRSIGMGRSPLDYLLLPVRVILQGDWDYAHFWGKVNVFWIVMIPLSLLCAVRNQVVRRCLGVAALYFIFWGLSSQQMRFLVPILPLLSIASALSVVELLSRIRASKIRILACWLCLVAAVGTLAWENVEHFRAGLEALQLYRYPSKRLKQMPVAPVDAFVNHRLPNNARLLCLNTNQGFFLERDYIADSFFEASQIADWLRDATSKADVQRRLEDRGITHVLVANIKWGIAYPSALNELLRDPQHATVLFRSKDGAVLELR